MKKSGKVKFKSSYIECISCAILLLLFLLNSCTKEDAPVNPYSAINYNTDTTPPPPPDPNSIVGLHKNIFSPRCAMPGCHDGTFEPDFRSVHSAYSTLVYQPVNKTTVDSIHFFSLRVIPFDVPNSFLHERLTTDSSDYMPSNGTRLSQEDIQHIDNWINNGAKDEFGNVPVVPDLPPVILGYIAFDSALTRLDTTRVGGISYNPFLVQQAQTVLMAFFVTDDSTSIQQLQLNQLKFSLDKDDFSGAVVVNASYLAPNNIWLATFSASYPPGSIVYFRYYVNDGHHVNPTEFPRDDSPVYYKSYASFYVQ